MKNCASKSQQNRSRKRTFLWRQIWAAGDWVDLRSVEIADFQDDVSSWRRDIQHNDIYQNDTQHDSILTAVWHPIGLHHPLDGVTNPEYKLLRFIQLTKFFCKEKKAFALNWDTCCHLALCLRLILFHSAECHSGPNVLNFFGRNL